ncbi:MAG TPA: vWA domain-containing protein [Burkholderiaceae bacterium]|nr:vWA domain-containing protein [Burkholderiaceae bacterium]
MMAFPVTFTYAWVLWGLPLALLPLWRRQGAEATAYPWLDLVPRDGWSTALDWALRLAAALAIAATLVSLAAPYRAEERVERLGQGAEIVLVLDRSRSMDEEPARGVNNLIGRASGYDAESKSAAARRVVSQFAAQRPHDAFGLVLFSNVPIPFLPFTQKQEVIQAALAAGSVGKGLGDTDIGRALLAGAQYFEARPYVGSRILLLISDGGARLDTEMRERIGAALKQHKIGVYWLYLVGRWGRRLVLDGSLDGPAHDAERDALPEQSLHHYFSGLGLPYRVYEADDPQAIQRAIDDVARVEQRPIQFMETLPRRDFMPWSLGTALVAVLLWLAAQALVRRSWA